MNIYAAVQCGLDKGQCEDTVIVKDTIINDGAVEIVITGSGAVCIADGVGGNAGGHIASAFVTEHLKSFAELPGETNENDIRERLIVINGELLKKGIEAGYPDMATTLTGLIHIGDKNYIVHIGNTRAYVLQGQYLKQLTTDHTVFNKLLKMGRVDEASQCKKNEITNCLGGKDTSLAAGLIVTPAQDFSLILLTSDGIHDFISVDELEGLVTSEADRLEKCWNILQGARNAGSTDDISAVIITSRED